jgi:centrosomal protein CEP76
MIEQDIERTLSICIQDYRDTNILSTKWDAKLSHLLEQCLWSLESQALDSEKEQYPDYFQTGIKRAIPDGHTFKGFPCNFNHSKPHRMFTRLLDLASFKQLILTQGDQVRFVAKAKIFPYAERVFSCWVMVGVSFKPVYT